MQNHQRNAQRIMRQDRLGDRFGRADDGAVHAKTFLELVAKLFEQVNMFRLFTGELQECPRLEIIRAEIWPGMVENERENEFFHETENAQICMPTDLVEFETFEWRQEIEFIGAGQRFRHERTTEIETLVSSNDVFDPPVNFVRGFQGRLI